MSPIVASQLQAEFGPDVSVEPLADAASMGRRVRGVDLSEPLSESQARALVAALDEYRIISFPAQDQHGVDVRDLERIANHFGAPIPHPKNYANYPAPIGELRLLPTEQRRSTRVNWAFPDEISCLDGADSPAVYIVTNLEHSGVDAAPVHSGGQHWHTDIEFEPVPLSTSLFLVQRSPINRQAAGGTWVTNPPRELGFYHPDSSPELAQLREDLPLNGETAYADTAAAYAALPAHRQAEVDRVQLRRRLRVGDDGWLVPLVYTNPRTGMKSLHSPVWASRGQRIAPVEVDGMTDDQSRVFLDELERHCLQPQFRYDHVHTPGDVTIWSNFATLHTAPPSLTVVDDPGDARLLYRISCKGEPRATLPRNDDPDWVNANIVPPYVTPLA